MFRMKVSCGTQVARVRDATSSCQTDRRVCFRCGLDAVLQGRLHNSRQSTPASARIDFGRDIRPILSDKCFVCHGPDAANNKSKLRFDTEAHAFADLGNGRRAIVRGDPKQSQLVRRITAENQSLRMPPVYSGLKLTKQEIERLTEWIAQGAPGNSIGHSLRRSGRQARK